MRILAVNLGNSSVFAAVFEGTRRKRLLRIPTTLALGPRASLSKELKQLCRQKVDQVVFCSVVPQKTEKLRRLLTKHCGKKPLQLHPEANHGLDIGYREPKRLGVDRLAGALGAQSFFPKKNLIVVDCGTATTLTALSASGQLLGGVIFPGMGLWTKALATGTAQLPEIKIAKPRKALGRSPEEAIASGIFNGHLGALRETIQAIGNECFGSEKHIIVGTGGHACFFEREKLFTKLIPDLILVGLRHFAASNNHA